LRLGKAGRIEALQRFSWDAVADVVLAAYETAMRNRAATALSD
jgi:hypothetical protein